MKASELQPGMVVTFPMKSAKGKPIKSGEVTFVTPAQKSKTFVSVWLERNVNKIRVVHLHRDAEVEVS